MSINQDPFSDHAPINIVLSQWEFHASDVRELTIRQNEILLLLSNLTGQWATVRNCSDPVTGTAQSGLVPTSYLKYASPELRGYAQYTYHPESNKCIPMSLGSKLGVYMIFDQWALVKLDETDYDKAEIGYVRQGYIKIFDESGKEEQGPSSLKPLPKQYCFLCESSVIDRHHLECTRCRLPNGGPFLICRYCAYRRQACFAHQILKGEDHLFEMKKTPDTDWWCDDCAEGLDGNFYTCILCRYLTGRAFELCSKCHRDPTKPSHQHTMIFVSKDWRLTEPHTVGLREMRPKRSSYACNGCCRHVSGYALHCRTCESPGFDLCVECAEIDRATYLHDRWTRGAPHDFEIVHST